MQIDWATALHAKKVKACEGHCKLSSNSLCKNLAEAKLLQDNKPIYSFEVFSKIKW